MKCRARDARKPSYVVYTLEPAVFGNLLSQRRDATTYWYLYDGLGSADRLVKLDESEAHRYLYEAFGNVLASSGETVTNPYTWVGRLGYQQGASNTYYLRARWYDATLGRFTSRDPLRDYYEPNLYYYVDNRPTLLIDPSGLQFARIQRRRRRRRVDFWRLAKCVARITRFSAAATACTLCVGAACAGTWGAVAPACAALGCCDAINTFNKLHEVCDDFPDFRKEYPWWNDVSDALTAICLFPP